MCNVVMQTGLLLIYCVFSPTHTNTPGYCPPIDISLDLDQLHQEKLVGGSQLISTSTSGGEEKERSELQNTTMELLGEDFIPEEDKL